jgi:hypothetical protein
LGTWEYYARPLVEVLPEIVEKNPWIDIFCYSSSVIKQAAMQAASEQAQLTLRTLITGKIEHQLWRNALKLSLKAEKDALVFEVGEISKNSRNTSWILYGVSGGILKNALEKKNINAKCLYFCEPYLFNPLMILKRKMSVGSVKSKEIEECVKHQLEYVKDYLYKKKNRDIAHYQWTIDKFPWTRNKLDENEINLLEKNIDF